MSASVKVLEAVRKFVKEADTRGIDDTAGYFQALGLNTILVSPSEEHRSPVIVFDKTRGTVVPPIRLAFGPFVWSQVMPVYFDGDCDLLIRGFDIKRLPTMELEHGEWVVKKKGLIEMWRP